MKQTERGPNAHTKATTVQAGAQMDRKSSIGIAGFLKKGEHGGKFIWSRNGDDDVARDDFTFVDVKDPNFKDPFDDALHQRN